MKQKRKKGQCVYCGRVTTVTIDHIPPKNIFLKPHPCTLITVPSCEVCNNSFSKDDEYFRLVLMCRYGMSSIPDATKIRDIILRSLKHPKKEGFKRYVNNAIRFRPLCTPAGIFLGKAVMFDVDIARTMNVASRIVKGLFFHHSGSRLKDECEIVTLPIQGMDLYEYELKEQRIPFSGIKPIIIGNNAFSYQYRFMKSIRYGSFWRLLFYNRLEFICHTKHKSTFNNKH